MGFCTNPLRFVVLEKTMSCSHENAIRNGDFMKEDGTFMSEFFELVNEYEERLAYAGKNTSLPDRPNMAKVEELVVEINRKNLANR